jgi:phosphoribosylformylglycinamidine synthase
MAARGDVGVSIDTTKVPVREEGMSPYEILLSESQERMLVVARQGHESQVREILEKWDLSAAVIGEVIAEPVYRVTEGDRIVAEFPGSQLVSDCPMYNPPAIEDPAVAALRAIDVHAIAELADESDPLWTLERLLSSPTIASKRWAYRQYDSTVRTSTVLGPGHGDAAVIRLRHTDRAIALKTDCNGRYVSLDPRVGTQLAVAEAARNVACTGARPMAITNCLNFGNPKRPEVYFQFTQAVRGMGEACEALGTPVTGGNVSFYNENPRGAVYPTPVVGMVGLIDSLKHITRSGFTTEGDDIVLLGEPTDELGGSEYLARIHDVVAGSPPRCDLAREKATIEALLEAIRAGAIRSAHDCSDGGLAVALAECCIADADGTIGAEIELTKWSALPLRAVLFGEAQARIVVSSSESPTVLEIARRHGVPARVIGVVRSRESGLTIRVSSRVFRTPLSRLARAYHDAIPSIMNASTAEVAVLEQHPQPSGA